MRISIRSRAPTFVDNTDRCASKLTSETQGSLDSRHTTQSICAHTCTHHEYATNQLDAPTRPTYYLAWLHRAYHAVVSELRT